MMTLCASGRRVHVVADASTCTADLQRPQRSEDDDHRFSATSSLQGSCRLRGVTVVTFDAERRDLPGARACSSSYFDLKKWLPVTPLTCAYASACLP